MRTAQTSSWDGDPRGAFAVLKLDRDRVTARIECSTTRGAVARDGATSRLPADYAENLLIAA